MSNEIKRAQERVYSNEADNASFDPKDNPTHIRIRKAGAKPGSRGANNTFKLSDVFRVETYRMHLEDEAMFVKARKVIAEMFPRTLLQVAPRTDYRKAFSVALKPSIGLDTFQVLKNSRKKLYKIGVEPLNNFFESLDDGELAGVDAAIRNEGIQSDVYRFLSRENLTRLAKIHKIEPTDKHLFKSLVASPGI